MALTFDPEALGGGAGEFARNAEALLGHAATVEQLAALRQAFAGSGEAAWLGVAERLAGITNQLRAVQERATNAGDVLRTAADGSVTVDANNANNVRM